MKELTEYLSAASYITCSVIYPTFYKLVNVTLPQLNLSDTDLHILRDEFITIIKKRFYFVLDDG